MADLKSAIREMLRRGMTEAQVKENLTEMGVSDAEEIYRSATQQLSPMFPAPGSSPQPQDDEAPGRPTADSPQDPAPTGVASADEGKLADVGAKLDALLELNKRILETNRAILLRLKEG